MIKSWQKRCYKCDYCACTSICLKKVESRQADYKIVNHKQAEECPDYEVKKK